MTETLLASLVDNALKAIVGVVAFLAIRLIKSMDDKVDRIDGKIDALHAKDATHGEAIVELRVRTSGLESRLAALEAHQSDFSGFLQTLGFKKRDG